MEQKTKLSILAIFLVVIIAGSVYFVLNKKDTSITPITPSSDQELSDVADANKRLGPPIEIRGEVLSIAEKTVYIKLANGKGFAANINSKTPVVIQGSEKSGSLADLKKGQNVVIKVDNASNTNNAIQILINK